MKAPTIRTPPSPGARWSLSLYPTAAEAGGSFISAGASPYRGLRGAASDPERARAEAARRARGRLRRYCAANRLNRLGTLTYAPPFCTDPLQVRTDVALFFRSLRTALGGEPFAYVWVPELHKDGVRFHVHFAVGRYVPRGVIDAAWGHGFVHIKLLGDLPVGSGRLGEARLAARYLSKYVGKAIADQAAGHRPFGRHRYEVAQSFQPPVERITGTTAGEVIAAASERMGGPPEHLWNSDQELAWQAAPAVWASWRQ